MASAMAIQAVINRPGVAGPVLQSPPTFTDLLSQSSFSSKFSKHHKSQISLASDLKFWLQKFFPNREKKFVQHCEIKVGADACKGSILLELN